MNALTIAQGSLQGLTILRFAHAYETGGGVELHLRDLNRGLSLRNRLTTILVHLSKEEKAPGELVDRIGESNFIRVPLCSTGKKIHEEVDPTPRRATSIRKRATQALNFALFTPKLNRLFARSCLRFRRIPQRVGEGIDAGATTAELLHKYKVDLVVLHSNGGSDASEVIATAKSAGVPIALIHHFSNDKLGNLSVRQQVAEVDTVAGASGVGLPFYVRPNFTNLSDAVDLTFFRVENAKPLPVTFSAPVIFAPGRVTPEKGQMDALKVAIALRKRGLITTLVFAGRVDDAAFENSLRELVEKEGLTDNVYFAGELTLEKYRDWFSRAYMMLMPTHHHEGMPRTLVDSQAMLVPPLVYDIGGTRDGVRHNDTGFLVRYADVNAMTDHAAQLLNDPALRQKMALSGRKFVEDEFSMDAFLARHEKFYLETILRTRKRLR